MEKKETLNTPQLQTSVVDDGGEIDLVEIFYLFWGHAIQIILCAVLGGLLALK